MKISPRELREAQIPTKAFGFDRDVVDALLERAADTVEGLIEENRQLFEALERVKNTNSAPVAQHVEQQAVFDVVEPAQSFEDAIGDEQASEPVQSLQPEQQMPSVAASLPSDISTSEMTAQIAQKEDLINRTLMLAQKTADETLRSATAEADELILKSEVAARELVEQATAEAQHLTGTAAAEAQEALVQAKDQAQQMVSSARTEATEIVEKAQLHANEMYKAETDKFVDLVERLTTEREQLVNDIEVLQNFDSEHRAKLQALVAEDLSKLEGRETFNFNELPEITDLPKILEASKKYDKPVTETVAHAELVEISSGISLGDDAVLVEAHEVDLDEDQLIEDIELDDMSDSETSVVAPAGESSDDPFADFVNSQVDQPSSNNDDDQDVVAPAGSEPQSPSKENRFQPGLSDDSGKHDRLDDDDFFASLREAVNDESPLGETSDDEGNSNGIFKNFFDK